MSQRPKQYKPLLFTTTMRNPVRMKGLLNILSKFDGQILTNELAVEIMGEVIRYGLYRPTKKITTSILTKWGGSRISKKAPIGIELLNDSEVKALLENNPQKHKEAGFNHGWASRFATEFDFPKELGFVYYKIGEYIQFSKLGVKLAQSVSIEIDNNYINYFEVNPEVEQQVFLHALAKYQRNNPFVRVLNENVPLVLLLQVITLINNDPTFNKCGISTNELPLLIFWKNNNANELYRKIKKLRQEYRYKPSPEVIIDICLKEIMQDNFKKFNPKSIMREYPDDFIRKMRLTGLISLRGAGRFIDINNNEIDKINYILENYVTYPKFDNEYDYYSYMSSIDDKLFSISTFTPTRKQDAQLKKWLKIYAWDSIKHELGILSDRTESKDSILKYLTFPTRLEFLIALAIKSKLPNVVVVPNYPCDDEGIPTSTATGNKGDIECIENENGVLIEVTMSGGRMQTIMEVWPITRHLENYSEKHVNSMCYFIAPSIYIDSRRQIDFVKKEENLLIEPYTINEFITYLENTKFLYQ